MGLLFSSMSSWVFAESLVPPGIDTFFNNPKYHEPVLSPNGKYLAVRTRNVDGRMALLVLDTDTLKTSTKVASYKNVDVDHVYWINNERLYYDFEDSRDESEFLPGSAFAANRDGSQSVQLMTKDWRYTQEHTSSRIKQKVLPWDYHLISPAHDGSDDILVSYSTYSNADYALTSKHIYRLNTKTRELKSLIDGTTPKGITSWVLDTDGVPVVGSAYAKGRWTIYYHDKQAKRWETLANFDPYKEAGFSPSFIDFDGNFYVERQGEHGTDELFKYSFKEKQVVAKSWVGSKNFDLNATPLVDYQARKLIGLTYQGDAWETLWLDPKMKALQAKIDGKLPGTINSISCGNCLSSPVYLVTARSDRQPDQYLLYREANDELLVLGNTRPEIRVAQMGIRDVQRISARDGLPIPLYITKPAGYTKGVLPTVVLVHGGPWVRGWSWEWDAEAQFLASRGYLVLQPEFRGSTGYGKKLFEAGFKQWGQAMQDDVADATRWAIDQGLADPKRVAIAGASYGGYATLMGLIKHPELYRCGFQWVGVTDINLMFDVSWSDFSNEWLGYGMRTLVADPETDAAMIRQYSPLEQADKLRQPLLMAYGAQDIRVPIVHGNKFHSAVKRNNSNVEMVVYSEEGHGWYLEKNRLDFWGRVEKFLEQNLKQAK